MSNLEVWCLVTISIFIIPIWIYIITRFVFVAMLKSWCQVFKNKINKKGE